MVGISSIIFHSTQGIEGQMLNDIAMLSSSIAFLEALRKARTSGNMSMFSLYALPMLPLIGHGLFLISFSCSTFLIIREIDKIIRIHKMEVDDLITTIELSIIAIFLFWIPETIFCYSESLIDVFEFHAFWNIFSAFATHHFYIFVCKCYIRLRHSV